MENNEVFETLEETTNETEEVVNEEEEVEESEDDETSEETGEGLGKLVIVGAGLAAAGAVYGLVKCVKWVGKKATEKALITGSLTQIAEDGSEIEGGIKNDEATLAIEFIKDAKIKKQFIGSTVDTIIDFDIKKAFEEEGARAVHAVAAGDGHDSGDATPLKRDVEEL